MVRLKRGLARTCVLWLAIGVALIGLLLMPLAAVVLALGPLEVTSSAEDVVAHEPGMPTPLSLPGNSFVWGG